MICRYSMQLQTEYGEQKSFRCNIWLVLLAVGHIVRTRSACRQVSKDDGQPGSRSGPTTASVMVSNIIHGTHRCNEGQPAAVITGCNTYVLLVRHIEALLLHVLVAVVFADIMAFPDHDGLRCMCGSMSCS